MVIEVYADEPLSNRTGQGDWHPALRDMPMMVVMQRGSLDASIRFHRLVADYSAWVCSVSLTLTQLDWMQQQQVKDLRT